MAYARLQSSAHYYPGGMMMPGRNKEFDWSRMGYNGQQKDDEVYGKGNLNSAKYWEMDTRIIRRWNLDPVDQISISNYSVFRNNSILFNDPLGDVVELYKTTGKDSKYNTKAEDIEGQLAEGLKTSVDRSPFKVDEKGRKLEFNQEKYNALTKPQQRIADNIKGAIESKTLFVLKTAEKDDVIGEDIKTQKPYTLGDAGGGATDPKKSATIIWLPKSNSDITANSHAVYGPSMDKPLQFSKTLILYHELGGHGFLGSGRSQETVDYEDLVRTNMGLPLRGTHDAGYYRDRMKQIENKTTK